MSLSATGGSNQDRFQAAAMMLFKGYVDREQIDADVNKLTAYYRSFGYFDAKIGRQKSSTKRTSGSRSAS